MRERLQRFMMGRYGVDKMAKDLMTVSCVCLVISMFFRNGILELTALLVLAYSYSRVFSKNINARFNENQAYLGWINKVKYKLNKLTYRMKQEKTHHIYACPNCKQKIRVPRGKGKISIRCPKCHTEFVKRS